MLAHSCYTTEDALLFGVLMVKRQMCMYVTHGKDHVFLIDTMRTPYSLVHLRTTGSTRGREFCTIISMVEYSRYLWCKRTPHFIPCITFPWSQYPDRQGYSFPSLFSWHRSGLLPNESLIRLAGTFYLWKGFSFISSVFSALFDICFGALVRETPADMYRQKTLWTKSPFYLATQSGRDVLRKTPVRFRNGALEVSDFSRIQGILLVMLFWLSFSPLNKWIKLPIPHGWTMGNFISKIFKNFP